MIDLFERIVRFVMRDCRYLALYPARVERTNEDGTYDLLPDDAAIRGNGVQHVPARFGIPASAARLEQGARCLVGFVDGDPRKPYVAAWEYAHGSAVISFDGGAAALARKGDSVRVIVSSPSYALSGIGTGIAQTPNPSPPPPTIPTPVPPAPFIGFATIPVPVYGVVIAGARRVTA